LCFQLGLITVAALVAQVSVPGSNQQAVGVRERFEAEQRLSDLGYWTGPIDGELDEAFRHALTAFQKVEGRKRSGKLNGGELEALRFAQPPAPKITGYYHVEVDLHRQVLFVVDANNQVSKILPICSGNGRPYNENGQMGVAHTPQGTFKVLRKINGWRKAPLGLLYYPNYIRGGVAIHGSREVLAYPASHGCIRIPIFASKEFSQMTPVGTPVIVYDS
jgi:hypothetical protein